MNIKSWKIFKNKKAALIAVGIVVVLIAAVIIGAIIFFNNMLNRINKFDENDTAIMDPSYASMPTVEEVPIPTLDPYDFENMFPGEEPIGGDIINIMLVGQDTIDPNYRGLSDTMILISVNPEDKKLVMTSFLRDSYIDIVTLSGTGVYKARLNTAYCTGGIKQLSDTLAYNFGVEIDNFVEVDFKAFRTIVDTLGGIDIELTEAEYYHMKNILKLDVQEGMNHMGGKEALAYARIRKIDSDFYRTERQRRVINEILKHVKNCSILEILDLAETVFPLVTTDMSNKDITKYIIQLVPMLQDLEVETLRIPIDGSWTGINAGTEEAPKYVLEILDLEANRIAIREAIGISDD